MSSNSRVIHSFLNVLIALCICLKPSISLGSDNKTFDKEISEYLQSLDLVERQGLRIESHGTDHDLVILSTKDKIPNKFKIESCETPREQIIVGRIENYSFGPEDIIGSPGFIAENIVYDQNKMTISGLSCNPEEHNYKCCPNIPDSFEAEYLDGELLWTKLPITFIVESIDSNTEEEPEPSFEVTTYEGTTRVLTHGTYIWGNQFGLNLEKGNCSSNRLWLSITSYEDELQSLVGKTVNFEWHLGDQYFPMPLDVTDVVYITSEIKIVLFNGVRLQKNIVNLLKDSEWLSLKITGPEKIIDKFYMPEEMFYLKDFETYYDQAVETCNSILK